MWMWNIRAYCRDVHQTSVMTGATGGGSPLPIFPPAATHRTSPGTASARLAPVSLPGEARPSPVSSDVADVTEPPWVNGCHHAHTHTRPPPVHNSMRARGTFALAGLATAAHQNIWRAIPVTCSRAERGCCSPSTVAW